MTKPSWQDYGTYDESEHARLWDGVVGAWCPSLGPTGSRLFDHSRANNWGTLTNMDNATDWVVDGGQYALDFDGTNDFISLGAKAGDLTETLPFSVSAWALARTTGSFRGLLSRDFSGPYPVAIRFSWGSTLNVLCDGVELTGPTVSANVWFHYLVVFAPSLRRIYLNGVQSIESTASYSITANNDELRIGTDYIAASDRVWDGLIGEITIYNRALNANEVRDLYLLGRGGMFKRRRRSQRRAIEQALSGVRRRRLLTGMV
jgi:hypothetical protein